MSNKLGPLDYTGREIREGDRIAYPVRAGSSMWLTDMVIEKVVFTEGDSFLRPYKLMGTNARGNRCVVQELGRCVIIKRKDE